MSFHIHFVFCFLLSKTNTVVLMCNCNMVADELMKSSSQGTDLLARIFWCLTQGFYCPRLWSTLSVGISSWNCTDFCIYCGNFHIPPTVSKFLAVYWGSRNRIWEEFLNHCVRQDNKPLKLTAEMSSFHLVKAICPLRMQGIVSSLKNKF